MLNVNEAVVGATDVVEEWFAARSSHILLQGTKYALSLLYLIVAVIEHSQEIMNVHALVHIQEKCDFLSQFHLFHFDFAELCGLVNILLVSGTF